MAGKTISAYIDTETANRVAYIARIEQRKPSQIAGMALKLFVELPPEARAALWQIEALGSPADMEAVMQEIARTLLHAQYRVAHRQVTEQMQVENLVQLETEDDILSAARQAVERYSVAAQPTSRNMKAWEEEKAFIQQRIEQSSAQNSTYKDCTWNREDLYPPHIEAS